jgi:Rhs element Vgr protein
MKGVVTAVIRSESKEIKPEYSVVSIDVTLEVNRIPAARIVLLDGDAAKQEFPISNNGFFAPGKNIDIQLKYEGGTLYPVFDGIVVKHGIKTSGSVSYLIVDLRAQAVKLAGARKSAIFTTEKKDSKIIESVITKAKLTAGTIAATTAEHQQLVQYYATDWDFILSRADINGLLVVVEGKTISVIKPKLAGQAALTIEYGKGTLLEMELESDIRHHFKSVVGTSWDPKTQKMSAPENADSFAIGQPVESNGIDEEYTLSGEMPLEKAEIKSWVNARMMKDRLSLIRGRIRLEGDGSVKLLDTIEIKGTGQRFNGKTLVTGIRHQVSEQSWQTSVQFGLVPDWYAATREIVSPPAAGLLPYVNGLQIGLVEAFEADPDGMFRIKLKLPAVDEKKESIWARLATPDAGKNRGYFFIPEKGDEVVVGFFNDDPRQAVILGSLYSKQNAPPEPFKIADKNPDKGIITLGELKILLNDSDKTVEVSTPAGNKLILKDKDGLELTDKNGNQILMNAEGISIKSDKDIIIDGKTITLKGSKVDVN